VLAGEYCHAEVFRASCADDEVILMERALYGRMSLGRCVQLDMGHLGCRSDVLSLVDRRCSGRRRCLVRVPDAELESRRPCLGELKTYLFASYRCVRGACVRVQSTPPTRRSPRVGGVNRPTFSEIKGRNVRWPRCVLAPGESDRVSGLLTRDTR